MGKLLVPGAYSNADFVSLTSHKLWKGSPLSLVSGTNVFIGSAQTNTQGHIAA